MNIRRLFLLVGLGAGASAWLHAQPSAAALVRHAPTINGTVEGSVQVMTAENIIFNSSAAVTGNLLVPGTPTVRLNGNPTYGGTQDGSGAAAPSNYSVTLNSGAALGHVVRRTNPISLPTVSRPPAPKGTRSVSLDKSGQSPGDFATLKNLTLNSNVGSIAVPPGTYGDFTANAGGGFTLGLVGASTRTVYNFQNLTLNSNSTLQVVGPVVVTVDGGFSTNSPMGAADHPAWLSLRIAGGGLSLASYVSVYGFVEAPDGTITLNSGSRIIGGAICDRLSLNSGAMLRLIAANQPPTVALISPADGASLIAFKALTLTATATDTDGAVSRVEFFNGTTKLGDGSPRAGSPSTFDFGLLAGLPVGTYAFAARATDNAGAATTSAAVTISVTLAPNAPPQVALTAPAAGAVLAANTAVTLSATATDADGTIARVEFFDGATKLGETGTPASTFAYDFNLAAGLLPGSHRLYARATDNAGAFADSAPVAVTALATLPYTADFEAAEGYVPGSLAGQLGWSVTEGAASITGEAFFSGARSVVLPPSAPLAKIVQTFALLAGQDIVFVDFYAKPVADADLNVATTFDVESSRFAVARGSANGGLRVFDGDGAGGGRWLDTGFAAPLAADGSTQNWVRLTARLDFSHKTWDLYANGAMVAADLGFRDKMRTALTAFAVRGDATANSRLDYLLAASPNPLFADANSNGIDDAWETAHGLSLSTNNRQLSPAGNGVTVVQAYISGTDPNDYYGGVLPVLTSLVDGGQPAPQGQVAVRVTRASDGSVLANAPVSLAVTTGATQISAAAGGTGSSRISIRTDSQGIAQGYINFISTASDILVASAQSGTNSISISIAIAPPVPPPSLPYSTGFEASDGFQPGALSGQKRWMADSGVAVIQGQAGSGGNYVLLPAAAGLLHAKITFASYSGQTTADINFFTQASAGVSAASSSQFRTDSAQAAVVQSAGVGQIYVFNGNGAGGGAWQTTNSPLPLDANHKTVSWLQLTIREDFSAKTWSLYLNGTLVAQNLRFSDDTVTSLGYFAISGGTDAATLFDGFSAGFDGTVFPDYGQKTLPASITAPSNLSASNVTDTAVALRWSASNSPIGAVGYVISRDGQSIGTTTGTTFTDSTVGEDTDYSYAVRAFDGVGNLSALSNSITVHTPPTLDSANGLPVDWEMRYFGQTGLDPSAPSGNGDGYTIVQEYQLGRDPTDFYNGVIPLHNVLFEGGPGPNGELALVVQHSDGTPWPNAPVSFDVTAGSRRISDTPDGPIFQYGVQVRADANGLAQVYLEPLTP